MNVMAPLIWSYPQQETLTMTLQERLEAYLEQEPQIDPTAYVAAGAVVIGAVKLAENSSVWHNAVLRGDINEITVGEGSNIQDGAVVHLADEFGCHIGKYVTVGHLAMVHACTVEDECLIGMTATILDGAVIGKQSIVGAGALVTKNTIIPPGSLVLGSPAKVIRPLTDEEKAGLRPWAEKYVENAAYHKAKFGA